MGTICIAALAGCAHSEHATGYDKAEPSGFLKDYSKLHAAANETDSTLLYFMPDKAKFKSYTKIWLEPVQVWRGEKSDAKDLNKADATYLSQFLWSRLNEELRKDYMMVQEPGPGVMRLRVGITEAGKNIPVLDNLTAPVSMVLSDGNKTLGGIQPFVGKATIEAEATDSQTGELLAAAVDRRGGSKYAWKSLHRWGDVEAAYTYWAKKFAWRACMMRVEFTCEPPEE
ncbi:MAG: DUF3313 domain-containing protein [Nitrospirae bacterium]|nr:DUF3313 domain-containing protein [Nitrospirota bacterium]